MKFMSSLKLGLIPEQLHGLTDPEVGVDAVVLRDCTQVDFVKAEALSGAQRSRQRLSRRCPPISSLTSRIVQQRLRLTQTSAQYTCDRL